MDIPHYVGGHAGRTEIDPSFLGERVLIRTLRLAITMYEANKRVGTHSTLTRADVARSKKALFRQKGTGRARVRHPQVTQCRGGGRAHGPKPRDYSYRLPKKALKVALRSAILGKFQSGTVVLAEELGVNQPKTRLLKKVLDEVGCQRSTLVVDVAPTKDLLLAARNLPKVNVLSVRELNALDVARHNHLVITRAAFEALKEAFSDES